MAFHLTKETLLEGMYPPYLMSGLGVFMTVETFAEEKQQASMTEGILGFIRDFHSLFKVSLPHYGFIHPSTFQKIISAYSAVMLNKEFIQSSSLARLHKFSYNPE